ncbi:unnamed protein product [Brassicogethes aeneus]|uniref:Cytochrome P450 n=1 Tax=Brassicogethes aeneus TaxID=1431903 RepID=A0A9P0BM52_BRAAE|nr:unnamed protein product [Brassicogethes aeneus]
MWTFFIACLILFILYVKWKHSFWKNKGLLSPKPVFFFGNTSKLVKQKLTYGEHVQVIYNYLKNKNQIHGGEYFLLTPIYIPVDPKIIKNILLGDFTSFMDRGLYYHEDDPLSCNLFFLEGVKSKKLRAKMTPTFTSGKMKMMFETLLECSKQLQMELEKNCNQAIEVKDVLERFTTDIIGSVAFGIECNSLKNPNCEFINYGLKFFTRSAWGNIIAMFSFCIPEVLRFLKIRAINKETSDFYMRVVKDTVDYREANNIKRRDFMHLLIQLKNTGKLEDENLNTEDKISFEELAAQAFIFFIAGFETSSATMTFALYELALNQDIQNRVREEVIEVLNKNDKKLTYDAVMNLSYMDQVINETIRLHPPITTLNRICTKDYKVPGTDFVLEKGTKVNIPVMGLHMDEEYFPDPTRFDPGRFSEKNVKNITPFTFLPFGEGPRNCIGERFGKMQTKVGLAGIIQNYKLTLSSKTSIPLVMDPKHFVPTTKGGMWLEFKKINDL